MGERNRQLTIALSNEEFMKLDHIARERGWSRSALVRHLLNREHEASKTMTPLQVDGALCGAALKARDEKESHD